MSPAERIAQAFHAAYEALAPTHGYETREASAKPWPEVPEQNRALMIATVQRLLDTRTIFTTGPDERDPLCWPCFRDRNRADGRPEYDERADAYVSACNACGHDHGD